MESSVDFDEWLEMGIANNWCSDLFCWTHEWLPMDGEEMNAYEPGDGSCYTCVRLL